MAVPPEAQEQVRRLYFQLQEVGYPPDLARMGCSIAVMAMAVEARRSPSITWPSTTSAPKFHPNDAVHWAGEGLRGYQLWDRPRDRGSHAEVRR